MYIVIEISSWGLKNGLDSHFSVKSQVWLSQENNTGQPRRNWNIFRYCEVQPNEKIKVYNDNDNL